ncbi:MAG: PDZ domain-containing protein [Pseudomonadota bacterium]
MKTLIETTLLLAALALVTPASAQEAPEGIEDGKPPRLLYEEARREAEREVARRDSQIANLRGAMETARARNQSDEQQVRIRMEEAERKLAEAARQIAELSQRNLPQLSASQMQIFSNDDSPRLGITISGNDQSGAVDGVTVAGVTPGGAAADVGLEAGDVITKINNESLAGGNSNVANEKLIDFMRGVEMGDTLKVEYLRDGDKGSVELQPRKVEANVFAWRMPEGGATYEFFTGDPNVGMQLAPNVDRSFGFNFAFPFAGRAWSDLEIIELNEGLGRYFGTDSGLLVVSAPESTELQLQDGDVIKSIDGREPESVSHAMRILSSYEPGESLDLNIMRDKRKRTLKVQMPDDRRGFAVPPTAPGAPASAPLIVVPESAPPAVIVPDGQQRPLVILESDT